MVHYYPLYPPSFYIILIHSSFIVSSCMILFVVCCFMLFVSIIKAIRVLSLSYFLFFSSLLLIVSSIIFLLWCKCCSTSLLLLLSTQSKKIDFASHFQLLASTIETSPLHDHTAFTDHDGASSSRGKVGNNIDRQRKQGMVHNKGKARFVQRRSTPSGHEAVRRTLLKRSNLF